MARPIQLSSMQWLLFATVGLIITSGCDGKDTSEDTSETIETITDTSESGSTTPLGTCANPEAILDDAGEESGYVRCDDGVINRVSVVFKVPTIEGETCAGDEFELDCSTDADCGAYGRCLTGNYDEDDGLWTEYYYSDLEDPTYCRCATSCATDSDCTATNASCIVPEIVATREDYPYCSTGECNTNDDCDSGECSLQSYDNGCGDSLAQLVCRKPEVDECRTDSDCTDEEKPHCIARGSTLTFTCMDDVECTD